MRLDRALILVFAFTLLVRWLGQEVIVPTFGFAVAAAFFLPVYVALVWLGVVKWGGVGLGELGWRWRWQDLAWGLLGLLLLSAWILPWTGAAPGEWLELATRYPPHARARFVVIGLTAAFLEETFFRGCLQSALARRHGTAIAIAGQAVVFALSHLVFTPERLLILVGVGVILGALRTGSRTLFAPALAHALLWAVWGGL